ARTGRDPGEQYRQLTHDLGDPVYERIDAAATPEDKAKLARLAPADLAVDTIAGEPITGALTTAPAGGSIGGVKVMTENGWFAARPSGTEAVYKLYAESFRGRDHLRQIQADAQTIIERAIRRDRRAAL